MTAAGTESIRWGIIGTGGIASAFAADLRLLPDASLVAVGSRRQSSANEFADRFDVPHRHASYDALVADEDVDVVYVATPHPDHYGSAQAAIEAGKAVLIEKPFTLNASQARDLVDAARARGVFLMEAMWTRFLPHVQLVRSLIEAGTLGDVRLLIVDHCQWFERDATSRLFDPALGGGALLDLGIYPVSFASMILGTPSRVTAVSDPAFTGVDASTTIALQHLDGSHASLTTTLQAAGPNRAFVVGTDARIEIDSVFYAPTAFTLIGRDGSAERFDEPTEGRGMQHEAAEVMRCLRAGRLESTVMPLDETVAIMETLDEVRHQIGLTYPGE
ncbi:MAG: Gfo/Idh/MocA family protein [Actinomycetes bacterium]